MTTLAGTQTKLPFLYRRHPERSEGSLYSPNVVTLHTIAKLAMLMPLVSGATHDR